MNNKTIILTGDRPTGPLHLGHYVGHCASAPRCNMIIGSLYWWLICKG